MKKTKAKPVKGSARAKKFDAGGLAALAGLGALAYMMRKKKGESEGSAPKDKSGYSSGPVDVRSMIEGRGDEEPSAEVKRAMAASKGRPELVPEGADEAAMRSDVGAKRAMPAPKRTTSGGGAKPAAKTEDKPASVGMTGIPISSGTAKPNDERPSKPYPKGVKGTTTDPYQRPSLNLGLNERAQAGKSFRERLAAEGKERMAAEEKAKAARRKGVADTEYDAMGNPIMKRGGAVKASKMGTVKQAKPSMGSASKRADGIAQRGKTRGRIC
jgi:hypothetical protein